MILTCSRDGRYTGGYVSGLIESMSSPMFGGWLRMESESDIARGRSKLMERALAQPIDSFLWVDDDIVFTKANFDRICAAPVECVGGVYCKRHDGRSLVMNDVLGDEVEEDRDIVTVKEVGTGFLRVTRRAVEKMADIVPDALLSGFRHFFSAGVQSDGEYKSEDYAFCRNIWASGTPVHLHRGIKLGHTGSCVYTP